MDITQQDFDYFIRASLDFTSAGPERHYACPASQDKGWIDLPDGTRHGCALHLLVEADPTGNHYGLSREKLRKAWVETHGEMLTETNARGFDAVCKGFDKIISHYAPQFMPSHAPTAEVEPVMGLA